MKKGLRVLTVFLVLLSLASPAPSAQYITEVDDVLSFVRTPEDLARWFSSEFTYRMVLPDGPHTVQEVIQSRSGDCDDFANLASAILTRIGIRNEVVVISFRKLKIAHAVCAWKDRSGHYSFISNRELCRTEEDVLENAIMKFYPDCESTKKLDPQMYVCL